MVSFLDQQHFDAIYAALVQIQEAQEQLRARLSPGTLEFLRTRRAQNKKALPTTKAGGAAHDSLALFRPPSSGQHHSSASRGPSSTADAPPSTSVGPGLAAVGQLQDHQSRLADSTTPEQQRSELETLLKWPGAREVAPAAAAADRDERPVARLLFSEEGRAVGIAPLDCALDVNSQQAAISRDPLRWAVCGGRVQGSSWNT